MDDRTSNIPSELVSGSDALVVFVGLKFVERGARPIQVYAKQATTRSIQRERCRADTRDLLCALILVDRTPLQHAGWLFWFLL